MLKELLPKGYTEIPLRLTSVGIFEIEVNIDGIDAIFFLDTGAANTVIDSGFAITSNLELADTDMIGGGVGTSELGLHKISVKNFIAGNCRLKNFELYAADFKHVIESLRKKGITDPIHGVLGADVLIPYKAIIDYGDQKLYLKMRKRKVAASE